MFHKDLTGADIHETKVTLNSGTPVGSLTPSALGILALDTVTNQMYRSTGLTSADWVATAGGSSTANALASATTVVDVVSATAPSTGQFLRATDSTHATWQTVSPGGLTLAGSSGNLQYNNGSADLGAGADLTWVTSSYGAGALGLGINLSGTGVPAPAHALDVNGEIRSRYSSDGGGTGGFKFGDPGTSSSNWCLRKTVTGNDLKLDYYNGSWATAMTFLNASGNVGINQATPTTTLHITKGSSGAIRLEDTTQSTGRILSSDSNGVGSWKLPNINVLVGPVAVPALPSYNLDWTSYGIVALSLGHNTTITFSNAAPGQTLKIAFIQDSSGGHAISFTPTIKWAGGVPPTFSTGANAIDIISVLWTGSDYFGFVDGLNMQ